MNYNKQKITKHHNNVLQFCNKKLGSISRAAKTHPVTIITGYVINISVVHK